MARVSLNIVLIWNVIDLKSDHFARTYVDDPTSTLCRSQWGFMPKARELCGGKHQYGWPPHPYWLGQGCFELEKKFVPWCSWFLTSKDEEVSPFRVPCQGHCKAHYTLTGLNYFEPYYFERWGCSGFRLQVGPPLGSWKSFRMSFMLLCKKIASRYFYGPLFLLTYLLCNCCNCLA